MDRHTYPLSTEYCWINSANLLDQIQFCLALPLIFSIWNAFCLFPSWIFIGFILLLLCIRISYGLFFWSVLWISPLEIVMSSHEVSFEINWIILVLLNFIDFIHRIFIQMYYADTGFSQILYQELVKKEKETNIWSAYTVSFLALTDFRCPCLCICPVVCGSFQTPQDYVNLSKHTKH